MQSTNSILVVRPANFCFNAETAISNAFQNKPVESSETLMNKVLAEFDAMVRILESKGVNVVVIEDTPEPVKPDAIFPNNWISLHPNGEVVLYPMMTPNRRAERRIDILDTLKAQFEISLVTDVSSNENESKFLEGTGSIIFDHPHKKAYACLSPRTDKALFKEVCRHLGYEPISFKALDASGKEIYHTNVMMGIGSDVAIICSESIVDSEERDFVTKTLTTTNHQIIDISLDQVSQLAGNVLEVQSKSGAKYMAMSQSAFDSLKPDQLQALNKYCEPLPLAVPTIEGIGGGSVRCMMCEVFLPPLK